MASPTLSGGDDSQLRYARRAPGGGWTDSEPTPASYDLGRYTAIAVSPDGFVHVVLFENGANDLHHLRYCP